MKTINECMHLKQQSITECISYCNVSGVIRFPAGSSASAQAAAWSFPNKRYGHDFTE